MKKLTGKEEEIMGFFWQDDGNKRLASAFQ